MGKKSKKKSNDPGVKRGAPDHFKGVKQQFLDLQAVLYQQALDDGKTTEFYNLVTRDFVAKFGDMEPFSLEPTEDSATPPPMREYVDEGEAADATKRWSKLRTVSNFNRPITWLQANV